MVVVVVWFIFAVGCGWHGLLTGVRRCRSGGLDGCGVSGDGFQVGFYGLGVVSLEGRGEALKTMMVGCGALLWCG